MPKFKAVEFLLILLAVFFLPACSSNEAVPEQNLLTDEGWALPDEYAQLTNPLDSSQANLSAGEKLYQSNCKSCHGELGKGDGIAGTSLNPPPPDFTGKDRQAKLTDSYYFWRISEGGNFEPFNSAMPGWKAIFTEQELWQMIIYLRSLAE